MKQYVAQRLKALIKCSMPDAPIVAYAQFRWLCINISFSISLAVTGYGGNLMQGIQQAILLVNLSTNHRGCYHCDQTQCRWSEISSLQSSQPPIPRRSARLFIYFGLRSTFIPVCGLSIMQNPGGYLDLILNTTNFMVQVLVQLKKCEFCKNVCRLFRLMVSYFSQLNAFASSLHVRNASVHGMWTYMSRETVLRIRERTRKYIHTYIPVAMQTYIGGEPFWFIELRHLALQYDNNSTFVRNKVKL